ncbi:cupin domain-containing protein [Palleronia sp.]|uniref:cupin domain-containing protein n=1 Tax=Palleronia sp. TaxID=1940284 RepID=UPI0035C7D106
MTDVKTMILPPGEDVPNNPNLPVVILRGAVAGMDAGPIRDRMEANGWGGTWTWTVYDYHHYHPDAHEALAVATGEADLTLGGPEGERVTVQAGDCLILPAGTGHKLNSSSDDFRICGAYPAGQEDFETRRAEDGIGDSRARIAEVALPETDPIEGKGGALLQHWR